MKNLSPSARKALIAERLTTLSPAQLEIIDESAAHVGHPGAQSGASHFAVTIVSSQFTGLSLIKRHQMVYHLLKDLIPHEIHALKINARTPEEI